MLIYEKKVDKERKLFGTVKNIPDENDREVIFEDEDGAPIELIPGDTYLDDGKGGIIRKSDGKFIAVLIDNNGEEVGVIPSDDYVSPEGKLESISIDSLPTKVSYYTGETLEKAGLKVTALYTDDTTYDVTNNCTLSPTVLSTAGEQVITVTYETAKAEFKVQVTQDAIDSIAVTTMPTTVEYVEGQTLNTSGMKVTATYLSGKTEDVTKDVVCTPTTLTSVGDAVSITVTYNDKTTTFNVKVVAKAVTSLSVELDEAKTEYKHNEALDTSNVVVTAYYNDNTSADVTGQATFSPANGTVLSTVGEQKVTVSYEGKSIQYDITVNKVLTSIAVTKLPDKTEYYKGEVLATNGIVVTGTYSDQSTEDVTALAACEPTDGTVLNEAPKEVEVKVSILDMPEVTPITFTINVHTKSDYYWQAYSEGEEAPEGEDYLIDNTLTLTPDGGGNLGYVRWVDGVTIPGKVSMIADLSDKSTFSLFSVSTSTNVNEFLVETQKVGSKYQIRSGASNDGAVDVNPGIYKYEWDASATSFKLNIYDQQNRLVKTMNYKDAVSGLTNFNYMWIFGNVQGTSPVEGQGRLDGTLVLYDNMPEYEKLPEQEVTAQSFKQLAKDGVITLDRDTKIPEQLSFTDGETYNIDLGSSTLTVDNGNNAAISIAKGANVTISGNGNLTKKGPNYVVNNSGTLTINGGYFTDDVEGDASVRSALIRNLGTLTINDGNFTDSGIVVKNDDNSATEFGTAVIKGGTFNGSTSPDAKGNGYACIQNSGKMTIKGGTFSNGNSTVLNGFYSADATLDIEDGTFISAPDCAALSNYAWSDTGKSATLTVKGGSYRGAVNLDSFSGDATNPTFNVSITGGDFSNDVANVVASDRACYSTITGVYDVGTSEDLEKDLAKVEAGKKVIISKLPEGVSEVTTPEGVLVENKTETEIKVNGFDVVAGETFNPENHTISDYYWSAYSVNEAAPETKYYYLDNVLTMTPDEGGNLGYMRYIQTQKDVDMIIDLSDKSTASIFTVTSAVNSGGQYLTEMAVETQKVSDKYRISVVAASDSIEVDPGIYKYEWAADVGSFKFTVKNQTDEVVKEFVFSQAGVDLSKIESLRYIWVFGNVDRPGDKDEVAGQGRLDGTLVSYDTMPVAMATAKQKITKKLVG